MSETLLKRHGLELWRGMGRAQGFKAKDLLFVSVLWWKGCKLEHGASMS